MSHHQPKELRRAEILEAAARCFARSGYHQTTMDDVVQASSLSKGALYWHFKSKQTLFTALVAQWHDQVLAAISREDQVERRPADGLRAVLVSIGRLATARRDLLRVYVDCLAMAGRDPALAAAAKEVREAIGATVRALLNRGMAMGAFRHISVEPLAWHIQAMIDGTLLAAHGIPDGERDTVNWNAIANALLEMLEV